MASSKRVGPTAPLTGLGGDGRCVALATKRPGGKGVSMAELPLMEEIARYNEVDCKVMMEIVRYLRTNH